MVRPSASRKPLLGHHALMENAHDVYAVALLPVEDQMAALGLLPVAGEHVVAGAAQLRSLGEPVKGLVEGKHVLIALLAPPVTFRVLGDGA